METGEPNVKEQHTHLLSGRDILSFFFPLIVTVSIALIDSGTRSEKIRHITNQGQYVYSRISFDFERFYFVYIVIALAALVALFCSKRRRIKQAATCAFIGNFLIGGGLTLLWWAFRDFGAHD